LRPHELTDAEWSGCFNPPEAAAFFLRVDRDQEKWLSGSHDATKSYVIEMILTISLRRVPTSAACDASANHGISINGRVRNSFDVAVYLDRGLAMVVDTCRVV